MEVGNGENETESEARGDVPLSDILNKRKLDEEVGTPICADVCRIVGCCMVVKIICAVLAT